MCGNHTANLILLSSFKGFIALKFGNSSSQLLFNTLVLAWSNKCVPFLINSIDCFYSEPFDYKIINCWFSGYRLSMKIAVNIIDNETSIIRNVSVKFIGIRAKGFQLFVPIFWLFSLLMFFLSSPLFLPFLEGFSYFPMPQIPFDACYKFL